MLFTLRNVKANPFRNIANYPIKREKIEALKQSIQKTRFWKNIVARECKGVAEIAYGHHRLTALNELYGPDHKVELIIEQLDNETMIQIMAHENMQEWGHNVTVEHETIRAVVQAYGDGQIKLPAVPRDTPQKHIRSAPSFKPEPSASVAERPYTDQTLAEFIGWLQPDRTPQEKVRDALNALELIDDKLITEAAFEGLSKMQARAVIQETRRVKEDYENAAKVHRLAAERAEREAKEAETEKERRRLEGLQKNLNQEADAAVKKGHKEAKEVAQAVSEEIKSGKSGYKQAREVATKVRDKSKPKRESPDIEKFARQLSTKLNNILHSDDKHIVPKLKELVKYRTELDTHTRQELINLLKIVADRFLDYAEQLEANLKLVKKG